METAWIEMGTDWGCLELGCEQPRIGVGAAWYWSRGSLVLEWGQPGIGVGSAWYWSGAWNRLNLPTQVLRMCLCAGRWGNGLLVFKRCAIMDSILLCSRIRLLSFWGLLFLWQMVPQVDKRSSYYLCVWIETPTKWSHFFLWCFHVKWCLWEGRHISVGEGWFHGHRNAHCSLTTMHSWDICKL